MLPWVTRPLRSGGPGGEPEPLTACPSLGNPGGVGHHSLQSPGDRRVRGSQEGTLSWRETREGAAALKANSTCSQGPCLPRLADQQQPQEAGHQLLLPRGGTGGPESPRSTPGAPTCPSSAQDQSHTGKPRCRNSEDPGPVHRPAHSCRERGRGKLLASASLLQPGSCQGFQHCRAGQLRPQAAGARAWRQVPVTAQPHPCKPWRRLRQGAGTAQGLHCPS